MKYSVNTGAFLCLALTASFVGTSFAQFPGLDLNDATEEDLELVRGIFTGFLGPSCEKAVEEVITIEYFTCLSSMSDEPEDSEAYDEAYFENFCGNDCFGLMFNAAKKLISCADPDIFEQGDSMGLTDIENMEVFVDAACAKQNGVYCGTLTPVFDSLENGNVTKQDCEDVVTAGKCLATILNAIDEDAAAFGIEDDDLDLAKEVVKMDTQCEETFGVSGVAAAAESSAFGVVSSAVSVTFAVVSAVVIATLA